MSTCPDPRLATPHACEGRCRCYPNHFCNLDCTCSGCGEHRYLPWDRYVDGDR